ncbi:MAG: hypothetical protein EAZ92_16360, partial [Candidatus Kapaibacterium sp.]
MEDSALHETPKSSPSATHIPEKKRLLTIKIFLRKCENKGNWSGHDFFWTQMKMIEWMKMMNMKKTSTTDEVCIHALIFFITIIFINPIIFICV